MQKVSLLGFFIFYFIYLFIFIYYGLKGSFFLTPCASTCGVWLRLMIYNWAKYIYPV
jgi:hypothetical protein